MTIRGVWSWPQPHDESVPSKEGRPPFIVTSVNGRIFEKPGGVSRRVRETAVLDVIAAGLAIVPEINEEWELRGIETGGYLGIPGDAALELFPPPEMFPAIQHRFGFHTRFEYITRRVSFRELGRAQPLNDRRVGVPGVPEFPGHQT